MHRRRRRPRHSGRHAPERQVGGRGRADGLHAGGKFDNDSYKVSGGLHGVGVSVVNALSEWLEVEVWRDGQVHQQRYERGKRTATARSHRQAPKDAARRSRSSPTRVFETTEFNFDTLAQRLRELAFLNAASRSRSRTSGDGKSDEFLYEGGIVEYVKYLNESKAAVHEKPIYMKRRDATAIVVEVALQYNDGYNETILTFANNINTHDGGTHLSGFNVGADADDQPLRARRTTWPKD